MNYFSARDLIIDHFKAEAVKASVACRVLPCAGWKHAIESLQAVPGIFVWHQTDKIPTGQTATRNSGKNQIVDQVWSVAVGVMNVSDAAGAGAQDDAEPIIEIVQSLQGVNLDKAHGHCYRVQSQYMSAYLNGFGVFPFAFQTRIFT